MSILLISDVHLSNKKPHVIENFLYFLYYHAIKANHLYILGDLFDIWIGDDDPNPLHKKIANALRYLHYNQTTCHFIHGNHDFLLGQKYAITCNMKLLPDKQILRLFKYHIILLHGDTLCTNDHDYKIFRKYIRKIWIKNFFLLLPISVRLYIGHVIQNIKKKQPQNIQLNINQKKITNILSQTNTTIMIHGHFHQNKVYYNVHNQIKKIERIILGSWNDTGSVIEINQLGIYLKIISFKNQHQIQIK